MTLLEDKNFHSDPFEKFRIWYQHIQDKTSLSEEEVSAFSLATCNSAGRPSLRMLLLKDYNDKGFIFFSHIHSHKGQDLSENPNAAMCFYWSTLERQVRIEGIVERLEFSEVAAYYQTRPRLSQIGAWASRQSEVMKNPHELVRNIARVSLKYPWGPIPCPSHWGGFLLKPNLFEFWEGKPYRLHHREQYRLEKSEALDKNHNVNSASQNNNKWIKELLFP